ncbi:hypothetical protein BH10ACI4_BH10ACI4_01100 [soil metagenome]
MRDNDCMQVASPIGLKPEPRKLGRTLVRNSAANIVRLGVTSLVAILLPVFLTHRLPVATYGAWILILQLGAYVSYLDFGVQTAVAKYIAEYEAMGDLNGCRRCASVAAAIMLAASGIGVFLTLGLAWQVPSLFRDMPVELLHDVRVSVLFVGISLAINLATSVFSAIFLGLQKYQIPMIASVMNRLVYATVIYVAVTLHCSLVTMAIVTAIVNVLTALLQFGLWKKLAGHIEVSFRSVDFVMAKQMLAYCAVLTVWSACMLVISGIDVTIVGHYAFQDVAFYSIATSPSNLILMVIGAGLGPLLPAASALSVDRSSEQMGALLLKSTRYSTIILLASAVPVLVGAYPLVRLWVGPYYAEHSIFFLRVLLIANIVRNLLGPYATMVVAVSRQKVATFAAITEAVVNLCCSILFARHLGAKGVALGTLVGSVAGIAVHFAVSMHYTQSNLKISRLDLFVKGILRPALMAIPTVLLAPYWWRQGPTALDLRIWTLWFVTTLLLLWFGSLTASDRAAVTTSLRSKLKSRSVQA